MAKPILFVYWEVLYPLLLNLTRPIANVVRLDFQTKSSQNSQMYLKSVKQRIHSWLSAVSNLIKILCQTWILAVIWLYLYSFSVFVLHVLVSGVDSSWWYPSSPLLWNTRHLVFGVLTQTGSSSWFAQRLMETPPIRATRKLDQAVLAFA